MNHPRIAATARVGIVFVALLAGPRLAAGDAICLGDFEADTPGQPPRGWEAHADVRGTTPPYVVQSDATGHFLAARDRGESVILARKARIDIERHPYLSFRWRVHELPRDGDERHGATGDSAAAVYVTYGTSFGFIPIALKYVWSSTLPVGTALRRSGTGRPWIVVAASGTQGVGEWRHFVFDIRAAYRQTFGEQPPRHITGVGLLSDANATRTTAYADYDDICFLSHADPPAGSGVEHVVQAD